MLTNIKRLASILFTGQRSAVPTGKASRPVAEVPDPGAKTEHTKEISWQKAR
jgi:hypothetical protein